MRIASIQKSPQIEAEIAGASKNLAPEGVRQNAIIKELLTGASPDGLSMPDQTLRPHRDRADAMCRQQHKANTKDPQDFSKEKLVHFP